MKKLLFFLVMVIILASCASTNNIKRPAHTDAYDTYKHRKQIVKENQKNGGHYKFNACKKKHSL